MTEFKESIEWLAALKRARIKHFLGFAVSIIVLRLKLKSKLKSKVEARI